MGNEAAKRREAIKYVLKMAAIWIPITIGVITFFITIGFCVPATKVQTITAAATANDKLEKKIDAENAKLSESMERRESANNAAHEKLDQRIEKLGDEMRGYHNEVMRELRGVGSAPSGPTFQRGQRIK